MHNDPQNDLDAFVLDDHDAFGPEPIGGALPPEEYEIVLEPPPDADAANGMLRRMRGIDRELRTINALADQEVHRIETWRADRASGLTRRRDAIAKALEAWMRAVNRLNPKRKSESLPNGKVALRAPGGGSLVVTNEHAFLTWWRNERTQEIASWLVARLAVPAREGDTPEAWAAELLELVLTRSPLVRIKPEPNKTALKELDTGPAVPVPDSDGDVELAVIYGETDLDREVIPGVAVLRSTVDTFSATPA